MAKSTDGDLGQGHNPSRSIPCVLRRRSTESQGRFQDVVCLSGAVKVNRHLNCFTQFPSSAPSLGSSKKSRMNLSLSERLFIKYLFETRFHYFPVLVSIKFKVSSCLSLLNSWGDRLISEDSYTSQETRFQPPFLQKPHL